MLVPFLANEIDKAKAKFNEMNSFEKAQWVVDQTQAWLKKRFGL